MNKEKSDACGKETAPLPEKENDFTTELPSGTGTPSDNAPVIKAEGVTYSYRSGEQVSRGVTGVSVEIYPGEFVVILGRNGSGKSTLAKLLNGFLVPDEGVVTVNGHRRRR